MRSLLAHGAVLLALVSADEALTAGNDVPPTRAGLGAGAISGHAVPCLLAGASARCSTPGERLPGVTELAVAAG